jgi:3-oxoacyl-[acyl-carrier protein] reductase
VIYEHKVAIVTGAAGNGMGRSIALTLAREGAHVVVNYLTSAECAAAVVRHIEGRGGRALAFQADVTEEEECRELVKATVQAFGQVDICIIGPGGGWHPDPIDKLNPVEALDDVQRELAPLYHLMPLVLPGMYERKWGRLIGIAQHPQKRSPAYAYNAGKAARSHALYLAQDAAWSHGVTVNAICPGPVAALPSLQAAVKLCDHGESWAARTNVTPQDVAEGVAMLCSEAGRFITGCQLPYVFD